jgi:hypothetical protein
VCGASPADSAEQEVGTLLRVTGESSEPAMSFARPESPAAPLPTRVPGQVGGDAPWESFAKSWETSSDEASEGRPHRVFLPPAADAPGDGAARTPRIDQFFRATTSVREAREAQLDDDPPAIADDLPVAESEPLEVSDVAEPVEVAATVEPEGRF